MKPVPGHALISDGGPFDEHGKRLWRQGHRGPGRAKCECGLLSPVLPSTRQRQEWHRGHKRDQPNRL